MIKSRSLSVLCVSPLIAVVALIVAPAIARCEDLDARKTGPQLFEQACSACHHGPGGLAKGKSASDLVDFLRQHYTSGPGPAGQLAAYLLANRGDGRRARPVATNPSGPENSEPAPQPHRPVQTAEPSEPDHPAGRVSRRHRGEQPANTTEAPASPAAEEAVSYRGRKQRAARHPSEPSPAEGAPPESQSATGRIGVGNKRQPSPSETRPQSPVAAEAAAPIPQPASPAAAPTPPAAAPIPPAEAPAADGPPVPANDQPAFSAPTP